LIPNDSSQDDAISLSLSDNDSPDHASEPLPVLDETQPPQAPSGVARLLTLSVADFRDVLEELREHEKDEPSEAIL
jgi:hypothetical protein